MADGGDDNPAAVLVEDHAPITDPQPRSGAAFQPFTSPWPVSANCSRRALTRWRTSCESFSHWLVAAGVKVIRLMRIYRILRYFGQGWARVARALLVTAVVAAGAPALAVQPDEILKDGKLEARARALSQELRCMVCQNQSIDDSDAPLAKDLRVLVRERLSAGDSDSQVIDFLVTRYGEFVLLRPRLTTHTLLLWLAPFAVLVIGAVGFLAARRRTTLAGPARLSADEEARINALLDKK